MHSYTRMWNRIGKGWSAVLIAAVVIGLLSSGCAPKPKVYRVGILAGLEPLYDIVDGFREKMTELGYVEGENIAYDLQKTKAEPEAEKLILQRFVAGKVDLILVFPAGQAIMAKEVTRGTDIPVVFCQVNIEGIGLVQSVSKPGGNITGVRMAGPDLAVKRLEVLHELAPNARRIWVPYQKDTQMVPAQLEMLQPAAAKMGVTLIEAPFAGASELLADLERRDKGGDIGIDAILLILESLVKTPAVYPKLNEFISRHKVPIGGVIAPMPGSLTLFGVATENLATGRQAALQANKILKGSPAGMVPVATAENYFQLNYRLAREQGLTVPGSLLKQANEVIR